MLRIKARDLGPQNIGSVITLVMDGVTMHTTVTGVIIDSDEVLVSTPQARTPLALEPDTVVEMSLQHSALSTSQLQKDFHKFLNWAQQFADEVYPYEDAEVAHA